MCEVNPSFVQPRTVIAVLCERRWIIWCSRILFLISRSSRLLQINEIGGRSLVWTEDLRSHLISNFNLGSGIRDLREPIRQRIWNFLRCPRINIVESYMRVSVIVPVRDEEHSIRRLLDGLLNQTRLPDEIIITDGGSLDGTTQIIEQYIKKGDPIRWIRAGAALPGRGRNLAATEARFEWLGFIDAGIQPAKDWLERLTKRAEQHESIDVVYGSMEPGTDTFFKECAEIG